MLATTFTRIFCFKNKFQVSSDFTMLFLIHIYVSVSQIRYSSCLLSSTQRQNSCFVTVSNKVDSGKNFGDYTHIHHKPSSTDRYTTTHTTDTHAPTHIPQVHTSTQTQISQSTSQCVTKMDQQLRGLLFFQRTSLYFCISSTHVKCVTTTCDSILLGSYTLF